MTGSLQKMLVLFIFMGAVDYMQAQAGFQKSFGGSNVDIAWAICNTPAKGLALAGYSSSFGAGGENFYLIKTDPAGNKTWARTYGGNSRDELYAMQLTADSGYILAGYERGLTGNSYSGMLVRLNSLGDTLWSKIYAGAKSTYANSVQQTADGGFIFGGYSTSTVISGDSGNAYLVKTDALGNLQWAKVYGGPTQYTDAYSIVQTTDKGYAFTGYTNSFGELNGDAFLAKTDSLGVLQFFKTYGNKGVDWGNSLQQTGDGGFIIGGTYSTDSTSSDADMLLIKTDANGDTLWTRTFGGTVLDYGQSIVQTQQGGYAVAGYTNSFGNGNFDYYLVKCTAAGDTLFSMTFGGSGVEEANGLAATADGGFALAGFSDNYSSGFQDFYLVKTDSNGNSFCSQEYIHAAKKAGALYVNTVTAQQAVAITTVSSFQSLQDTGCIQLDLCISGIASQTKSDLLKIYPNPSDGIISLSAENLAEKCIVTISDIRGGVVYRGQHQLPASLDLTSLTSGIYFAEINCNNKSSRIKLFIGKDQ